jgi:hypothetical protein
MMYEQRGVDIRWSLAQVISIPSIDFGSHYWLRTVWLSINTKEFQGPEF